ncbi:hypothetical protein DVH24_027449, partial [Malus domestica]
FTRGCGSRNHEPLGVQFYLDHLKVDFAYKINRFHVVRNKTSSKVVHHATIVEMNKKTTIVPVDKTSQEIPMQWNAELIGEEVRVTLWTETATSFENSAMQSLLPPIFVALTTPKVKQYQGKHVLRSTRSIVCFFNPDIA